MSKTNQITERIEIQTSRARWAHGRGTTCHTVLVDGKVIFKNAAESAMNLRQLKTYLIAADVEALAARQMCR